MRRVRQTSQAFRTDQHNRQISVPQARPSTRRTDHSAATVIGHRRSRHPKLPADRGCFSGRQVGCGCRPQTPGVEALGLQLAPDLTQFRFSRLVPKPRLGHRPRTPKSDPRAERAQNIALKQEPQFAGGARSNAALHAFLSLAGRPATPRRPIGGRCALPRCRSTRV